MHVVGGKHGKAIARADDKIAPDNHVSIAIAIGGGTERKSRSRICQRRHQIGGIDRIRIGVPATEIGQRNPVDHRPGRSAKTIFENRACIRPGHGMHGIETHAELRAHQQVGDFLEIEKRFEQFCVIRDGIDDLNDQIADLRFSERTQIDIRRLDVTIEVDILATQIDGVGKGFVGRSAIRHVVLDTEIALRTARIVAGRENDAAKRTMLANDRARCRRRENPVLPDHDSPETRRRGHAQNRLDRHFIEVPSIAAQNKRLAFVPGKRVKNGLDEVLQIAWLRENLHLLAQPRSSRFLT